MIAILLTASAMASVPHPVWTPQATPAGATSDTALTALAHAPQPADVDLDVGVDDVSITIPAHRSSKLRITLEGAEASTSVDFDPVWGACVDGAACADLLISDGATSPDLRTWSFDAPALGGILAVRVTDIDGTVVAAW